MEKMVQFCLYKEWTERSLLFIIGGKILLIDRKQLNFDARRGQTILLEWEDYS